MDPFEREQLREQRRLENLYIGFFLAGAAAVLTIIVLLALILWKVW
jgi:hypothetical protein